MNKINISNAPAYTSPNSMTLICTEKTGWQHQSCNSGILGFCVHQSRKDHVLPEQRGLQS